MSLRNDKTWLDIATNKITNDKYRTNLRSGDFVRLGATGGIAMVVRLGDNLAGLVSSKGAILWTWHYADPTNLLPVGLTLDGLVVVGVSGVGPLIADRPVVVAPGYLLSTSERPLLVAGAAEVGMAGFTISDIDGGRRYFDLTKSALLGSIADPKKVIGYWPETKFEVVDMLPKENWR